MKYTGLILIILLSIGCLFTGCIDNQEIENSPMTIYVGGEFADYTSLNDALEEATDGHTIILSEGIYDGTFIVNKSLTLKGEGQKKTRIISKNFYLGLKEIIIVQADNCTISDLSIINEENISEGLNIIGIQILSSNVTVHNVTISNMRTAIHVEEKDHCSFYHNVISSNYIGIHIDRSDYHTIALNSISHAKEYGLQLVGIYYSNITNNNLLLNAVGARLKGSYHNMVMNNSVEKNERGLYLCCGASKNILYNNVFINNSEYHVRDAQVNTWYNEMEEIGNYWDNYQEKHPEALQDGLYWDTPYLISGGNNRDIYPLISSPLN
jgi:parallel beta-helix repeat protein